MEIKNIGDFMAGIAKYFGGFPNDFVKDLYAEELSFIKPGDYTRLFMHVISTNPASWRPDVKAIKDGVKALRLDTLMESYSGSAKCPVCGTISTSSGVCPVCKYAGKEDGTPDEYRKFWEDWKANRVPRFDWSSIKTRRIDE